MCRMESDPSTYDWAAETAARYERVKAQGWGVPDSDVPEHNHHDERDANDDCPRCQFDIEHLAGRD